MVGVGIVGFAATTIKSRSKHIDVAPLLGQMRLGRELRDKKANPSNDVFAAEAHAWETATADVLRRISEHLPESFLVGSPQLSETHPEVRATDRYDRFMDVRLAQLDEIIRDLKSRS